MLTNSRCVRDTVITRHIQEPTRRGSARIRRINKSILHTLGFLFAFRRLLYRGILRSLTRLYQLRCSKIRSMRISLSSAVYSDRKKLWLVICGALGVFVSVVVFYAFHGKMKFPTTNNPLFWTPQFYTNRLMKAMGVTNSFEINTLNGSMGYFQFKRVSNDTSIACRHFDLPVWDSNMLSYYGEEPPLNCQRNPQWVVLDEDNKVKLMKDNITCEITEFYRLSDFRYVPLSTYQVQKHYQEYQLQYTDSVRVRCIEPTTKKKWNEYFLGTRKSTDGYQDEELKGKRDWNFTAPNATSVPVNVLIWTFDSVTRNTFIRKMPQSWAYMQNVMKGILLEGYNVVGLNTIHALTALFIGRRLQSFYKEFRYQEFRYVEDYMPNKTIFEIFRQHGYVTTYFEDEPNWGTFQYFQPGFRNPPTDHYPRTLMLERGWEKGFKPVCCGNTSCNMVVQTYFQRLWKRYEAKPKFFFGLQGTYSHAVVPDLLAVIDHEFKQFLEWIQTSIRNDTVVVIMGDHGHRYHSILKTRQGMLEMRMPIMCLLMPEWMEKQWPEAMANLRVNSKRLSTPMDLHVTLKSLLEFGKVNFSQMPEVDEVTGRYPVAMNLFQPMPKDRTCEMAEVSAHWCACPISKELDPQGSLAIKMAESLLKFINRYVKSEVDKYANSTFASIQKEKGVGIPKCEEWTLRSVRYASEVQGASHGAMRRQFKISYLTDHIRLNYYEIGVEVDPGPSNFQATWEYDQKMRKYKIRIRDVTRLDWYSSHSQCVDKLVPSIRMWCYCASTSSP